jgi:hypothetical protein
MLQLSRAGTSGQCYGQSVNFNLSRSVNTGLNAKTRFDIALGNGDTPSPDTTVMTMLSTGNVGIGTTSPAYTLDVNGSFKFGGYRMVFGFFNNNSGGGNNNGSYAVPGLTTLNFIIGNFMGANGDYAYTFCPRSYSGNVVFFRIMQTLTGGTPFYTGDTSTSATNWAIHYVAFGN